MNRIARITTVFSVLLASSAALAGERTVTLVMDKMTCASCPHIVKQSLTRVSGVKHVNVSFEDKGAAVTFDVGFPSRLADK